MSKGKWKVYFIVKESTTELDGIKTIDKKEVRATIPMDFEDVVILMNIVNSGTNFMLSALDKENFKAIAYEEFDPACWNDYYVRKIRQVDFDEREITIDVSNF